MNKIKHIRTISEFHRTRRLEPPAHPLISVVDYAKVDILPELRHRSWRFDFYFRSVTGLSAQQHIHQQVIERAKLLLSKPELSIAEVTYRLGFGHPQSFSKFFKRETNVSPLAYRQAFN